MPIANGTFDVTLTPRAPDDQTLEPTLGRLTIDKTFHGDLDATSKGEMMSAMGSVKGSAGYVALERVTGTLHGRSGSFVLQHFGIMNRGAAEQNVMVIPDSGTEELTGLTGTMRIIIAGGLHSYELQYELEER